MTLDKEIRRITKISLATSFGIFNLAGIGAAIWLTQTTPFRSAFHGLTIALTTSHRFFFTNFAIADLIPFGHQILSLINGSDAIAAIFLSTLITTISTLGLTLLLAADLPGRFGSKINQFQLRRIIARIQQLEEMLLQLDLYGLTLEQSSELLTRLNALYGESYARSQYKHLPCNLTPLPTA